MTIAEKRAIREMITSCQAHIDYHRRVAIMSPFDSETDQSSKLEIANARFALDMLMILCANLKLNPAQGAAL